MILTLADDLTGAHEAGGFCAQWGLDCRVRVACAPVDGTGSPALVVNTEARHATDRDARQRVAAWAGFGRQRGFEVVFIKTDSTLRGPIRAYLEGARAAFPGLPAFYLPAYPRLGRTMRCGRLYVHGEPIEESASGRDPLNRVRTGRVVDLLAPLPVCEIAPGAVAGVTDPTLYVIGAETEEEHAQAITALGAAGRLRLVAGPAGILPHLLATLGFVSGTPQGLLAPRGLLICGSVHPVTRRQIASLVLPEGWEVVASPGTWDAAAAIPHHDQLAARAKSRAARGDLDALVVTGGDTAAAVLRALGVQVLRPLAELMPGVPCSEIEFASRRILYISKSGGFGDPDLFERLLTRLTGREAS